MSRFKKLIHEVHRRSIWQVLLVYLGASYAILEAVDLFTERWGLPSWLFTAAAVLLVVGLLVVLTAAILPDTVEEVETSAEAAVLWDTVAVPPSAIAAIEAKRAAVAYLSLARGDTAGAVHGLAEFTRWPWGYAYVHQLTLGELLAVTGADLEAARILDQGPDMLMNNPMPAEILWTLERGRVNERLGNREGAIRAYSYVARAWADADSMLQPLVQEAGTALERLGREPRR